MNGIPWDNDVVDSVPLIILDKVQTPVCNLNNVRDMFHWPL